MNDLFAKLKRLFEPRPRPAESIGEPTADRPPPPAAEPQAANLPRAAEPPPADPPPAAEPLPANPPPAQPPPVKAAPTREPASFDVDDLAEIRAALEAVAEKPSTAIEPETVEPDAEALAPPSATIEATTDVPVAVADETTDVPAAAAEETTDVPAGAAEEATDVPAAVDGRVVEGLVLTLGTPPTTFTVAKASATLGRGQENTIRLDDLSVSRRHARIVYRQGGYWLSDLGSMGGTWVDGTRLNAPRRIASGEVIDIGLCRLTVSFSGGVAKSETRKSPSKPQSETGAQVRRRR